MYLDVEHALILKHLWGHKNRRDIRIDLNGENLPSEVLENLMVVEPIVRDQIVKEVNARIEDPQILALANIDVLALVNQIKPGGA